MGYIIGAALGLGICIAATLIGFDRDRAFYPVLTILIASYYDLFAILGGSVQALGLETVVMIAFIGAAGRRIQDQPLDCCGRPGCTRLVRLRPRSLDIQRGNAGVVADVLPCLRSIGRGLSGCLALGFKDFRQTGAAIG